MRKPYARQQVHAPVYLHRARGDHLRLLLVSALHSRGSRRRGGARRRASGRGSGRGGRGRERQRSSCTSPADAAVGATAASASGPSQRRAASNSTSSSTAAGSSSLKLCQQMRRTRARGRHTPCHARHRRFATNGSTLLCRARSIWPHHARNGESGQRVVVLKLPTAAARAAARAQTAQGHNCSAAVRRHAASINVVKTNCKGDLPTDCKPRGHSGTYCRCRRMLRFRRSFSLTCGQALQAALDVRPLCGIAIAAGLRRSCEVSDAAPPLADGQASRYIPLRRAPGRWSALAFCTQHFAFRSGTSKPQPGCKASSSEQVFDQATSRVCTCKITRRSCDRADGQHPSKSEAASACV